MLIERSIKFELSESGPLDRTCTSINGYFHDKTKIFKENLQVDYYLLLNNCRRRCTLLPPTWSNPLTKFITQMQDFKRVLDLNC